MKRTIQILFIACILVFGVFSAFAFAEEGAGLPEDPDQVAAVILHTNDVHVAFKVIPEDYREVQGRIQ